MTYERLAFEARTRGDTSKVNELGAVVLKLVDDQRRLRGLILDADHDPGLDDNTGKAREPLFDALMRHKAAKRALAAQAEAIRKERT